MAYEVAKTMNTVGTAIVGCGNAASFYCNAMPHHPLLQLRGVMDGHGARSSAYSAYYSVPKYESLDAVLNDSRVELALNLTNPRSHHTISRACLESGKHVYSEKPLAMTLPEAQELVRLAKQRGCTSRPRHQGFWLRRDKRCGRR